MKFVGADGCKDGWFTVQLSTNHEWEINIFRDICSLWNTLKDNSTQDFLILIDIPIGLKESTSNERLCDKQARKLLGKRKRGSVFRAPCRQSLSEDTYESASRLNQKITGKNLTKQAFAISSKIGDVDDYMHNYPAKQHVIEVHPELCFYGLAGHPMEFNKKKREGFLERKDTLIQYCESTNAIIDSALSKYKRKQVSRDDILDALSAAVTAKLCHKYGFTFIPENPEFDDKGLPMQIVYSKN